MENFLQSLNLQQYYSAFDEQGFGDFEFVKTLSDAQLETYMEAVGVTKIGHKMMITNSLKAANVNLSISSVGVDFQMAIDDVQPTVTAYLENVKTLFAPNELSPQIKFFNLVLKEIYETAYKLESWCPIDADIC